ncbi:tetratricopeptide repeat protein [Sphingomonas sp. H39-1-10]|uniref:SPOR domain-containing protein n=1 Tax=Sphingomonas pollutisoli TaxID=3030829 RepID=UPI0023B8C478|nr:SPOR domain-containing protein [Sphingomonas pollutisoli]MDF0489279.1 tetratricopeptide repeat protein [Sphingomonas pollutisoli]
MKTRAIVSLGASVLLLGGALAVGVQGVAVAGSHSQSGDARKAAAEAAKARALLARGKGADAVKHAERAALAAPDSAEFRMLLGQSYLKAGRFGSARDAFGDTLTLDAGNGKAALNLALAQIATGDWAAARGTLSAHADSIPVSDRGLAIALAGDPAAAVDLLASAARADTAGTKTRQNLALSLALAGRWTEARAVAGLDLSPADADKRIVAWGAFARPKAASDQVAALLGVTAVADKGRPAALALKAAAPVDVARAAPAPAEVAAAPDAAPSLDTGVPTVRFAARQEVVQPLAAKPEAALASKTPVRAAPVEDAPRAFASGKFYVQLGAFDTVAVARDAWQRAARRFPTFSGQRPQGVTVKTGAGSFYRLSLGGYARGDAVKLCASYRAAGGRCFVRAGAGDQLATWVKPGAELASR